jgi:hypothetical protein
LTAEQIKCFNWEVGIQIPTIRQVLDDAVKEAEEARARILALAGSDDTSEKTRLLKEAEEALENTRLIGDLAIAAFFNAENTKEREQLRGEYEAKVHNLVKASKEGNGAQAKLEFRPIVTFGGPKPIPPFHWQIEFPEVFLRENPGFDAFVGNPPFAGKNSISAANGEAYIPYLQAIHEESHGNSDLVAHFFRRAFNLVRKDGCFGLLATNTIAQGDTRHTGLYWICTHGGAIYCARKRYRWPGEAAVVVSIVHVRRGVFSGDVFLDEKPVKKITAYLFHAGGDQNPSALRSNGGKSYIGCYVLGMGFTFDDSNADATPISDMQRIIESNARNKERIFPYLGGEELNESPTQSFRRYVISFGDMSEREARAWPDLIAIVVSKVKPGRSHLTKNAIGRKRAAHWWQYGSSSKEMFESIRGLERMLVVSRIGQACAFAFIPSNWIPAETLVVFAFDGMDLFSVMQCRVHELWARFLSSSMKDDLRYSPSDCFETFPFPPKWQNPSTLEYVGKEYYETRAKLMVRNNEGLTKTYNRFHDPDERDPDILELRELHDAMDRVALDAYGWTDLKPTCDFFLDYEEEESESGAPRKRKKPWRYRWPDDFRDEVLARLLALNQERAAEEEIARISGDRATAKRHPKTQSKRASEHRHTKLSFD